MLIDRPARKAPLKSATVRMIAQGTNMAIVDTGTNLILSSTATGSGSGATNIMAAIAFTTARSSGSPISRTAA